MTKKHLILEISDLPEESVVKLSSLVRDILRKGGSVSVQHGDPKTVKRIQEIIESHEKNIPEGLQALHAICAPNKAGGASEPMILFYETFQLTNINEAIEVFMDDEKFQILQNIRGIGKNTIIKIMLALMDFPEYNTYGGFEDDGKELREIFPELRLDFPTREDIKKVGLVAFRGSLRSTTNPHNKICEIYRALFIRGIQIDNRHYSSR